MNAQKNCNASVPTYSITQLGFKSFAPITYATVPRFVPADGPGGPGVAPGIAPFVSGVLICALIVWAPNHRYHPPRARVDASRRPCAGTSCPSRGTNALRHSSPAPPTPPRPARAATPDDL